MKTTTLLAIVFLAAISVESTAQTVNALESISSKEFLKLPDGLRALYVGGVIDAMTFMSYNYNLPKHDQFVRCLSTITIGTSAQKTVDWIRKSQRPDDPMAVAVAKALGAYCKESGLL